MSYQAAATPYQAAATPNTLTSSNGTIFRVTCPLWGEFAGHRWISLPKTSDVELWCILWSAPKQAVEPNHRDAGDSRRHCAHYDVTVIICMMTSSNGNIFCVTGPLWGEFTGHRWIPLTNASDAKLWCFLWSAPAQTVGRTFETPVIRIAIALIMTSLWWFGCISFWVWLFHVSTTTKNATVSFAIIESGMTKAIFGQINHIWMLSARLFYLG